MPGPALLRAADRDVHAIISGIISSLTVHWHLDEYFRLMISLISCSCLFDNDDDLVTLSPICNLGYLSPRLSAHCTDPAWLAWRVATRPVKHCLLRRHNREHLYTNKLLYFNQCSVSTKRMEVGPRRIMYIITYRLLTNQRLQSLPVNLNQSPGLNETQEITEYFV